MPDFGPMARRFFDKVFMICYAVRETRHSARLKRGVFLHNIEPGSDAMFLP